MSKQVGRIVDLREHHPVVVRSPAFMEIHHFIEEHCRERFSSLWVEVWQHYTWVDDDVIAEILAECKRTKVKTVFTFENATDAVLVKLRFG